MAASSVMGKDGKREQKEKCPQVGGTMQVPINASQSSDSGLRAAQLFMQQMIGNIIPTCH